MTAPMVVGAGAGAPLGVVVIGRNEGERLRRCLGSLQGAGVALVYVDSGSTDDSVATAESLGASVLRLDMTRPFTAARARNEGMHRLDALAPGLDCVQFVDGDCEVAAGWLDAAARFLAANPKVAAVCGRRRERHPERSVYNLLCDIEWDTPVGPAKACGGDAMMRAAALRQVGGFREGLIAGEEPELCVRLRAAGWNVWRLDAEMTRHDAAMTRFGQWWQRSMRTGFAYAEGTSLHGAAPERHWRREARSAIAWGLVLPLALFAGAAVFGPLLLLGFAAYPLQVVRLYLRTPGDARARWARAGFLVLGKFAEAAGEIRFFGRRWGKARGGLIEYK